jgi:hypothetical protein
VDLPDLTHYRPHRVVDDIDLAGVVVPGLRGSFHRRPAGSRTGSVGVYSYAGVELFMAWGYVGEEHCRFTSYRRGDGQWTAARPGCPDVHVLRDGELVTAVLVDGLALPAGQRADRPAAGPPTSSGGRDRPRPEPPPPAAYATDSGYQAGAARPGVG